MYTYLALVFIAVNYPVIHVNFRPRLRHSKSAQILPSSTGGGGGDAKSKSKLTSSKITVMKPIDIDGGEDSGIGEATLGSEKGGRSATATQQAPFGRLTSDDLRGKSVKLLKEDALGPTVHVQQGKIELRIRTIRITTDVFLIPALDAVALVLLNSRTTRIVRRQLQAQLGS